MDVNKSIPANQGAQEYGHLMVYPEIDSPFWVVEDRWSHARRWVDSEQDARALVEREANERRDASKLPASVLDRIYSWKPYRGA